MQKVIIFVFILILIVGKLESTPRVRYPFYMIEEAKEPIVDSTPSIPITYGRFKNVFGAVKLNTHFYPQSLEQYTGKLSTSHRLVFNWYPHPDMLRGFFRTNF